MVPPGTATPPVVLRRGYAPAAVTPPVAQDFAPHCSACVVALQGSLRALYGAVDADVAKPQDVARRFRLNKNLTWKIAKLLQTADPLEAVPAIPGAEGIGILLTAMEREGAGTEVTGPVRRDFESFDAMMRSHASDRATLDLLIDGMAQGAKALEVSRKLAFRGNSGIWGLQARVRSMLQVLAPTAGRPDRLDDVLVGGLHDLRRLRPVQGWPIFRFSHYGLGAEGQARPRDFSPIEPPASPDEPALIMRSFCSPPGAEVRSVRTDRDIRHELVDGPIGQRGAVTFVFGSIERGVFGRYAPRGATEPEYGEMMAFVTLPTELVQMDVLVHRSMLAEFVPELAVYGRPFGTLESDPATRENYRLPITEVIERIDPSVQTLDSEALPDRTELVERVVRRAGWALGDFIAFRASIAYPPMPSSVLLRYRLPSEP
jgi:hypothetical protein